jgi:DNA-binding transcriptional ArsR family regulator
MNVERKPQVLGLSRQTRSGPALEIKASEASEVVMSLFLMTGDCDYDTYDLPTERLRSIKETGIPVALQTEIDELIAGSEVVAELAGFVAELEGPLDLPALVSHIEGLPATEIQLQLLGYYQHAHPDTPPELIKKAAEGDPGSTEALKAAAKDHQGWLPELTNLLDLGPDRVKELLLSILPAWHRDVWPKFGIEMDKLEAEAEARRVQAKTLPLQKLIETATNGFDYTPDPRDRRILLLPSIVLSPWMVYLDHKDQKAICYPASESAAETGVMGPAQLARFYKALGDEGRLTVLKRLAEGPLTLLEAAEALGVAKSTAHHHLGLLRHAGLVLIREEGGDKTYSLRRDLLPQAGEILNSFLGS